MQIKKDYIVYMWLNIIRTNIETPAVPVTDCLVGEG